MMRNKFLPVLFILIFAAVACNFSPSGSQQPPVSTVESTQELIESPTTVVEESPTENMIPDTETLSPTELPTATEAATVAPTATELPCPAFGFEDFDQPSPCWPYTLDDMYSVTRFSDDRKVSVGIQDSMLEFEFDLPEDVYLYSFNPVYYYDEVILQSSIQKIEPSINQNGFALVCHVNESGWYEARVESGGTYRIFQFDSLKKANGENPYIFIAEGGTAAIRIGAGRENIVRFECLADSLRLVINNDEVWFEQMGGMNSGGAIGLGLTSYSNKYPLHIGFDNIEIIQP